MASGEVAVYEEKKGLKMDRYFSVEEKNPFDRVPWGKYDIDIKDDHGNLLFTQKDSEFPEKYSKLARQIISSRYSYGEQGTDEREMSLRTTLERITETYGKWALKQGYMDQENAAIFKDELSEILLGQKAAPNSPVWFNVGTDRYESRKDPERHEGYHINDQGIAERIKKGEMHNYPQTSACFIQSVEDTMEDIMQLATNEAMLFKFGSGTGTDLSTLRSSREKLSGGGIPSGPLAYLSFYDRVAGIVKSGGKTRRAAKMNSLKIWHPDIFEFIEAKKIEEQKARALVAQGYDQRTASDTVAYQNANLSVRLTDEFMNLVNNGGKIKTIPVKNKELADQMPEYDALELMTLISEGTWGCGDPGVQYHDTINKWNTCKKTFTINASNPCSEYMFIDNSSCNLASINLKKFYDKEKGFDLEGFEKTIETLVYAMDLNYDNSSFPTKEIAQNSHDYRPLGVGYSNLGSLIMSLGLPYDSDEARELAASITALTTAKVYEVSSKMAEDIGPFPKYEENKESMIEVMEMHRDALPTIILEKIPENLRPVLSRAEELWDQAVRRGRRFGYRNAQATVLAPTGTISFAMDCDTTGIEPETQLVKQKKLAEGGMLRIVNNTVPDALVSLGYSNEDIRKNIEYLVGHDSIEGVPYLKEELYDKINKLNRDNTVSNETIVDTLQDYGYSDSESETIVEYIRGNGVLEGSPYLKEEHLPVFDTSLGERSISYKGHIKMMAAVQPFISGAISKTVNMPESSTVEDIRNTYMEGWEMGLKSIAIFRDNSKVWQVLNTSKKTLEEKLIEEHIPIRKKLPETVPTIRQKFNVAGHEGYIHMGFYPDSGKPGETFIEMSKEGSTIGGLMNTLATAISIGLQYAVPIEAYTKKFKGQRFEPLGLVHEGKMDGKINTATSLIDYIGGAFEILSDQGYKGLNGNNKKDVIDQQESKYTIINPNPSNNGDSKKKKKKDTKQINENKTNPDASFCPDCGNPMTQRGKGCEKNCKCGYVDFSGCGG